MGTGTTIDPQISGLEGRGITPAEETKVNYLSVEEDLVVAVDTSRLTDKTTLTIPFAEKEGTEFSSLADLIYQNPDFYGQNITPDALAINEYVNNLFSKGIITRDMSPEEITSKIFDHTKDMMTASALDPTAIANMITSVMANALAQTGVSKNDISQNLKVVEGITTFGEYDVRIIFSPDQKIQNFSFNPAEPVSSTFDPSIYTVYEKISPKFDLKSDINLLGQIIEEIFPPAVSEKPSIPLRAPGADFGNANLYIEPGDPLVQSELGNIFPNGTEGLSREEIITKIHNYMLKNYQYRPDTAGDTWNSPALTIINKAGDCEDLANLEASLLIGALGLNAGVTTLGVRERGATGAGHVLISVQDENGVIRTLDPTFNQQLSSLDDAAILDRNRYDIFFEASAKTTRVFNIETGLTFAVDTIEAPPNTGIEGLMDRFEQEIENQGNILNDYNAFCDKLTLDLVNDKQSPYVIKEPYEGQTFYRYNYKAIQPELDKYVSAFMRMMVFFQIGSLVSDTVEQLGYMLQEIKPEETSAEDRKKVSEKLQSWAQKFNESGQTFVQLFTTAIEDKNKASYEAVKKEIEKEYSTKSFENWITASQVDINRENKLKELENFMTELSEKQLANIQSTPRLNINLYESPQTEELEEKIKKVDNKDTLITADSGTDKAGYKKLNDVILAKAYAAQTTLNNLMRAWFTGKDVDIQQRESATRDLNEYAVTFSGANASLSANFEAKMMLNTNRLSKIQLGAQQYIKHANEVKKHEINLEKLENVWSRIFKGAAVVFAAITIVAIVALAFVALGAAIVATGGVAAVAAPLFVIGVIAFGAGIVSGLSQLGGALVDANLEQNLPQLIDDEKQAQLNAAILASLIDISDDTADRVDKDKRTEDLASEVEKRQRELERKEKETMEKISSLHLHENMIDAGSGRKVIDWARFQELQNELRKIQELERLMFMAQKMQIDIMLTAAAELTETPKLKMMASLDAIIESRFELMQSILGIMRFTLGQTQWANFTNAMVKESRAKAWINVGTSLITAVFSFIPGVGTAVSMFTPLLTEGASALFNPYYAGGVDPDAVMKGSKTEKYKGINIDWTKSEDKLREEIKRNHPKLEEEEVELMIAFNSKLDETGASTWITNSKAGAVNMEMFTKIQKKLEAIATKNYAKVQVENLKLGILMALAAELKGSATTANYAADQAVSIVDRSSQTYLDGLNLIKQHKQNQEQLSKMKFQALATLDKAIFQAIVVAVILVFAVIGVVTGGVGFVVGATIAGSCAAVSGLTSGVIYNSIQGASSNKLDNGKNLAEDETNPEEKEIYNNAYAEGKYIQSYGNTTISYGGITIDFRGRDIGFGGQYVDYSLWAESKFKVNLLFIQRKAMLTATEAIMQYIKDLAASLGVQTAQSSLYGVTGLLGYQKSAAEMMLDNMFQKARQIVDRNTELYQFRREAISEAIQLFFTIVTIVIQAATGKATNSGQTNIKGGGGGGTAATAEKGAIKPSASAPSAAKSGQDVKGESNQWLKLLRLNIRDQLVKMFGDFIETALNVYFLVFAQKAEEEFKAKAEEREGKLDKDINSASGLKRLELQSYQNQISAAKWEGITSLIMVQTQIYNQFLQKIIQKIKELNEAIKNQAKKWGKEDGELMKNIANEYQREMVQATTLEAKAKVTENIIAKIQLAFGQTPTSDKAGTPPGAFSSVPALILKSLFTNKDEDRMLFTITNDVIKNRMANPIGREMKHLESILDKDDPLLQEFKQGHSDIIKLVKEMKTSDDLGKNMALISQKLQAMSQISYSALSSPSVKLGYIGKAIVALIRKTKIEGEDKDVAEAKARQKYMLDKRAILTPWVSNLATVSTNFSAATCSILSGQIFSAENLAEVDTVIKSLTNIAGFDEGGPDEFQREFIKDFSKMLALTSNESNEASTKVMDFYKTLLNGDDKEKRLAAAILLLDDNNRSRTLLGLTLFGFSENGDISKQNIPELAKFLNIMQDVAEQTFHPTKLFDMFTYEKEDLFSTRNKSALGGKEKLQSAFIAANEAMKNADPSKYGELMTKIEKSSGKEISLFKAQIETDITKGFFRPLSMAFKLSNMRENVLELTRTAVGERLRKGDFLKLLGGLNTLNTNISLKEAVLDQIEFLANFNTPKKADLIKDFAAKIANDKPLFATDKGFVKSLKSLVTKTNMPEVKVALAEIIRKIFPEKADAILAQINLSPTELVNLSKLETVRAKTGKWGETIAELKTAVSALPLDAIQMNKVRASLDKISSSLGNAEATAEEIKQLLAEIGIKTTTDKIKSLLTKTGAKRTEDIASVSQNNSFAKDVLTVVAKAMDLQDFNKAFNEKGMDSKKQAEIAEIVEKLNTGAISKELIATLPKEMQSRIDRLMVADKLMALAESGMDLSADSIAEIFSDIGQEANLSADELATIISNSLAGKAPAADAKPMAQFIAKAVKSAKVLSECLKTDQPTEANIKQLHSLAKSAETKAAFTSFLAALNPESSTKILNLLLQKPELMESLKKDLKTLVEKAAGEITKDTTLEQIEEKAKEICASLGYAENKTAESALTTVLQNIQKGKAENKPEIDSIATEIENNETVSGEAILNFIENMPDSEDRVKTASALIRAMEDRIDEANPQKTANKMASVIALAFGENPVLKSAFTRSLTQEFTPKLVSALPGGSAIIDSRTQDIKAEYDYITAVIGKAQEEFRELPERVIPEEASIISDLQNGTAATDTIAAKLLTPGSISKAEAKALIMALDRQSGEHATLAEQLISDLENDPDTLDDVQERLVSLGCVQDKEARQKVRSFSSKIESAQISPTLTDHARATLKLLGSKFTLAAVPELSILRSKDIIIPERFNKLITSLKATIALAPDSLATTEAQNLLAQLKDSPASLSEKLGQLRENARLLNKASNNQLPTLEPLTRHAVLSEAQALNGEDGAPDLKKLTDLCATMPNHAAELLAQLKQPIQPIVNTLLAKVQQAEGVSQAQLMLLDNLLSAAVKTNNSDQQKAINALLDKKEIKEKMFIAQTEKLFQALASGEIKFPEYINKLTGLAENFKQSEMVKGLKDFSAKPTAENLNKLLSILPDNVKNTLANQLQRAFTNNLSTADKQTLLVTCSTDSKAEDPQRAIVENILRQDLVAVTAFISQNPQAAKNLLASFTNLPSIIKDHLNEGKLKGNEDLFAQLISMTASENEPSILTGTLKAVLSDEQLKELIKGSTNKTLLNLLAAEAGVKDPAKSKLADLVKIISTERMDILEEFLKAEGHTEAGVINNGEIENILNLSEGTLKYAKPTDEVIANFKAMQTKVIAQLTQMDKMPKLSLDVTEKILGEILGELLGQELMDKKEGKLTENIGTKLFQELCAAQPKTIAQYLTRMSNPHYAWQSVLDHIKATMNEAVEKANENALEAQLDSLSPANVLKTLLKEMPDSPDSTIPEILKQLSSDEIPAFLADNQKDPLLVNKFKKMQEFYEANPHLLLGLNSIAKEPKAKESLNKFIKGILENDGIPDKLSVGIVKLTSIPTLKNSLSKIAREPAYAAVASTMFANPKLFMSAFSLLDKEDKKDLADLFGSENNMVVLASIPEENTRTGLVLTLLGIDAKALMSPDADQKLPEILLQLSNQIMQKADNKEELRNICLTLEKALEKSEDETKKAVINKDSGTGQKLLQSLALARLLLSGQPCEPPIDNVITEIWIIDEKRLDSFVSNLDLAELKVSKESLEMLNTLVSAIYPDSSSNLLALKSILSLARCSMALQLDKSGELPADSITLDQMIVESVFGTATTSELKFNGEPHNNQLLALQTQAKHYSDRISSWYEPRSAGGKLVKILGVHVFSPEEKLDDLTLPVYQALKKSAENEFKRFAAIMADHGFTAENLLQELAASAQGKDIQNKFATDAFGLNAKELDFFQTQGQPSGPKSAFNLKFLIRVLGLKPDDIAGKIDITKSFDEVLETCKTELAKEPDKFKTALDQLKKEDALRLQTFDIVIDSRNSTNLSLAVNTAFSAMVNKWASSLDLKQGRTDITSSMNKVIPMLAKISQDNPQAFATAITELHDTVAAYISKHQTGSTSDLDACLFAQALEGKILGELIDKNLALNTHPLIKEILGQKGQEVKDTITKMLNKNVDIKKIEEQMKAILYYDASKSVSEAIVTILQTSDDARLQNLGSDLLLVSQVAQISDEIIANISTKHYLREDAVKNAKEDFEAKLESMDRHLTPEEKEAFYENLLADFTSKLGKNKKQLSSRETAVLLANFQTILSKANGLAATLGTQIAVTCQDVLKRASVSLPKDKESLDNLATIISRSRMNFTENDLLDDLSEKLGTRLFPNLCEAVEAKNPLIGKNIEKALAKNHAESMGILFSAKTQEYYSDIKTKLDKDKRNITDVLKFFNTTPADDIHKVEILRKLMTEDPKLMRGKILDKLDIGLLDKLLVSFSGTKKEQATLINLMNGSKAGLNTILKYFKNRLANENVITTGTHQFLEENKGMYKGDRSFQHLLAGLIGHCDQHGLHETKKQLIRALGGSGTFRSTGDSISALQSGLEVMQALAPDVFLGQGTFAVESFLDQETVSVKPKKLFSANLDDRFLKIILPNLTKQASTEDIVQKFIMPALTTRGKETKEELRFRRQLIDAISKEDNGPEMLESLIKQLLEPDKLGTKNSAGSVVSFINTSIKNAKAKEKFISHLQAKLIENKSSKEAYQKYLDYLSYMTVKPISKKAGTEKQALADFLNTEILSTISGDSATYLDLMLNLEKILGTNIFNRVVLNNNSMRELKDRLDKVINAPECAGLTEEKVKEKTAELKKQIEDLKKQGTKEALENATGLEQQVANMENYLPALQSLALLDARFATKSKTNIKIAAKKWLEAESKKDVELYAIPFIQTIAQRSSVKTALEVISEAVISEDLKTKLKTALQDKPKSRRVTTDTFQAREDVLRDLMVFRQKIAHFSPISQEQEFAQHFEHFLSRLQNMPQVNMLRL